MATLTPLHPSKVTGTRDSRGTHAFAPSQITRDARGTHTPETPTNARSSAQDQDEEAAESQPPQAGSSGAGATPPSPSQMGTNEGSGGRRKLRAQDRKLGEGGAGEEVLEAADRAWPRWYPRVPELSACDPKNLLTEPRASADWR